MDIEQYLKSNGLTGAAFAARIGVSEVSLSRMRRGLQVPRRDLMARIIEASGGAITADALIFHAPTTTPNAAPASPGKATALTAPHAGDHSSTERTAA